MIVCSQCGRENAPEQNHCRECGAALASAKDNLPGVSGKKAAFAGTMMGLPSPVLTQPSPEPKANPALGATLPLANPPEASANPRVPAPADPGAGGSPARKFGGTMVGMGLEELRAAHPATPPREASPADPAGGSLKKTMMGIATPGVTPTTPKAASAHPSMQSTVLGVARPGIAPSYPAGAPSAPPSASIPAPSIPPDSLESLAPGVPKKLGPLPIVLGSLGVLALGGILYFAFGGSGSPKLYVSGFEQMDETHDRLHFACDTCEDGTTLTVAQGSAKFSEKKASLIAPTLPVGDTRLEVTLSHESGDKSEKSSFELTVPVKFRVHSAFSALPAESASALVSVEAKEGASVSVDGKKSEAKAGKHEFSFPLGDEGIGESDKSIAFAHSYPVVVELDGKKLDAMAEVRGKFARLSLDTPAPHHVGKSSRVTVSGRTEPNGTVVIASQPIAAGPNGEFSLAVERGTLEELTVSASTKTLLPRRVTIPLGGSGAGEEFSGKVVEARVSGGKTTLLLDAKTTCADPPCLLRVLYGEAFAAKPGQSAIAIGERKGDTVRAAVVKPVP